MKRNKNYEFKPVKVYKNQEERQEHPEMPVHLAPALSTPLKTAEMPDANEAHMRHDAASPSAVIITSYCGIGTERECMYKDNCPILDAQDDVILKFLDTNVITCNKIEWCGHYQPRKPFSTGFISGENQ